MSPDRQSLIEKIDALPAEQVAEVEEFVDLVSAPDRHRALTHWAARASEAAFARIWDNPEDDVYNAL